MRTTVAVALILILAGGCAQPVAPTPAPSVFIASPQPTSTAGPTASPLPTPSATPGLVGRVVFIRYAGVGPGQMWVACADLSRQRPLKADPQHGTNGPVWSPDGTRIAFEDDGDIYSTSPSGGEFTRLTSVSVARDAAYSPDGRSIAFAEPSGIFVVDAAGAGTPQRLTTIPQGYARESQPRFSADGNKIVFTLEKSDTDHTLRIVNADGSAERELKTPALIPSDATWSVDGTQLVFEAAAPTLPYGSVWRINADGTGLVNLVPKPTTADSIDGFADPVWHLEGNWIMLVHALVKNAAVVREGLAVMKPDGSGLTWVSDGRGAEHQPDWNAAPC